MGRKENNASLCVTNAWYEECRNKIRRYGGGVRGGWYVGLPPCILHDGRDVCGDGLWPPDRKV